MRVFVSCGEVSGDRILANLLSRLKAKVPGVEFFGIAGTESSRLGLRLIVDQKNFGSFGIPGLRALWDHYKLLKMAEDEIRRRKPDLVLLVDYAEFNYNLTKSVAKIGIPVYWVSPPQVWVWRLYRLRVLQSLLTGGALILPFEEQLWNDSERFKFFGHPLGFLASQKKWSPDSRRIAIFPGSRISEIQALAPILKAAAVGILRQRPDTTFVIPCAVSVSILAKIFNESCFELVSDSLEALRYSSFAIIKSGTSSVEAACIGVPHAVVYKVPRLAEFIARMFLKVSTVSIVNILHPGCIKEFLQGQCEPGAICEYVTSLELAEIERISASLARVKNLLLPPGVEPFEKIAEHVISLIQRRG